MTMMEKLEKLDQLRNKRYRELYDNLKRKRPWIYEMEEAEKKDLKYKRITALIKFLERRVSQQLLGKGVMEYLYSNGVVRDKEIAIELLCQSSLAWEILDESLKRDPEVIMYYQPLGYRLLEYTDVDPEEVGICLCEGVQIVPQKGFELEYGENDAFLPKIEFPEGFDYETYFKIQAELSKHRIDRRSIKLALEEQFPFETLECFEKDYLNGDDTTIYDRHFLRKIVKKYYVPTKGAAVKTIGTHPEAK